MCIYNNSKKRVINLIKGLVFLLFIFVINGAFCMSAKAVEQVKVTVFFDANGGEISINNKTVVVGKSYGDLPTPVRSGYGFDGWYTEPSGGVLINRDTLVFLDMEHTLYAHWMPLCSGITLGTPKFNETRTEYSFPYVTVSTKDEQKILCVSVSQGGYFHADFEDIDNLDVSGVLYGGEYVDNNEKGGINDYAELESITVVGDITDDVIKKFIRNITFHPNVEQKVTAVSSSYDVRADGATGLAIDGELHLYKFIAWNKDQVQNYKGSELVNVPKSKVSEDPTLWTWFKAYELAKKQRANGLKGYLTTITSDVEQQFIYNKFGSLHSNEWNETGAWIGGARTFANGENAVANSVIFDSDSMPELYPDTNGDGSGERALLWRWMCGPESINPSTRTFFTLDSAENQTNTGVLNNYAKWNNLEPNNWYDNKYNQEFCLQYGYTESGEWGDFGPEHSPVGGNVEVSEKTGSGEVNNYKAPLGFLVEFSSYDINQDGTEDEGEIPTTDVEKDFTVVTTRPNIVKGELDKIKFSIGDSITVISVRGDRNPSDELVGTNIPVYQWEVYNYFTRKWENATGAGNDTKTYTLATTDAGKKLRVHVTAIDNDMLNPEGYLGGIYIDAYNSDDLSDKVDGTIVEVDDSIHKWDDIYTIDVNPTCTESGIKSIHCTICNEVKNVTEIPAKGHTWDSGKIITVPTETESGEKTYTCIVCGDTKTEEIPAMDEEEHIHEWNDYYTTDVEPTCTEPGVKSIHCALCSETKNMEIIPATGHVWDEGYVSISATETETGVMIYTCINCGEIKKEIIPATGSENSDNKEISEEGNKESTEKDITDNPPDNGESSSQPNQPTTKPVDSQNDVQIESGSSVNQHTVQQPVSETGDTSLQVPNGSKVIADGVKYQVSSVKEKTVTWLESTNNSLASATIPETITVSAKKYKVTKIADNAFKNNKKLKKVKIGKNITEIGKSAFKGCKKLRKLTMGKNVKVINNSAFEGCTVLTSITIEKNVKKIGKNAFYKCGSLKKINAKSAKLTSVGSNAFKKINRNYRIKLPKKYKYKYQKLMKGKLGA